MIESIEGKRGLPRHRPPYVAQVGLFGRPTLEQNVETMFRIRDIIEKGAEWATSQGRHERKGFRSFSVSGRVKNSGVKLAPAGITMRELIDEFCGGMQDGHIFKVSLPKTRFVRTGDAIRPRLHVRQCLRSARSGVCLVHPSQAKHEDATHYNRWRISQGSAAGALR